MFIPNLPSVLKPNCESKYVPPFTVMARILVISYSMRNSVPESSSAYELPPGGSCTTVYTKPSKGTVAQNVSSLKPSPPRGFEPRGMSSRITMAVTERYRSFRFTSTRTVRRWFPAKFGKPALIVICGFELGNSKYPSASRVTWKSQDAPPPRFG